MEAIGVERARASAEAADLVLWLGSPDDRPERAIQILAKADLGVPGEGEGIAVSAKTGFGLVNLAALLVDEAKRLLPREGEVALNARHRAALADVGDALRDAEGDLLVVAESLRRSRAALDRITGRAGVEDMLDALFGRFCIGK